MIRLTSKWTLKNGLTPELMFNLESAAERIQTEESGSLMYIVHLDESLPLSRVSKPGSLGPNKNETAITFIEIYNSSSEYSQQNKGLVFAKFREENLKYFVEDPENLGWPIIDSQMLKLDSGAVKHSHFHFQRNQIDAEAQV